MAPGSLLDERSETAYMCCFTYYFNREFALRTHRVSGCLHDVGDARSRIALRISLRVAATHHDDVGRRADRTQVEFVLFSGSRGEGDLDHREMQAEMGLNANQKDTLHCKATQEN